MTSSTFIAPKHVQAFDTLALDAMIKDLEVFPPFYAATAIRSNLLILKPPMTHSASYQLQQHVQIFDAISKYRCSDKSSRTVRFRRSHRHLITSLDSCINGDASNVEFGIIAATVRADVRSLYLVFAIAKELDLSKRNMRGVMHDVHGRRIACSRPLTNDHLRICQCMRSARSRLPVQEKAHLQ